MSISVGEWCKRSKSDLVKIMRKSCESPSRKMYERTPRDTEELAESMQPNIPVNQLQPGQTYVFGTNSPYAAYIEYLGSVPRRPEITRYHPRGPYGMRATAVAEFAQDAREIARGI